MVALVVIFSFILFFGILFFDAKRREKSYIGSYVVLIFILQYCLVPVAVYYFNFGISPAFFYFVSQSNFVVASIVVCIFAFSFFVGYVYSPARGHKYFLIADERLNANRMVILIFIISILTFYAFINIYGGIDYVLATASRIRSGTDDNKNYFGAFFKLFSYYIEIVLFYLVINIVLGGKNRFVYVLLFVAVFVIAFFKSFADAGRGGLLNIFIGMMFAYFFASRKIPIKQMFVFIPLIIFVVFYGKIFIFQMFNAVSWSDVGGGKDFLYIADGFVAEFSHPFLSLDVAIGNGVYGERYFSDLFIFFLKPFKLLGIAVPDSISYYNTFQITGIWDSEIPPGAVLFWFYQAGIWVIPIGGFLSGYVLRWFDKFILNSIARDGVNRAFVLAWMVIVCVYLPFIFGNSDPALFVQWVAAYLILFISLLVLGKLRIRRFIKI